MLPFPIAASQTDANSPVDDNLMDSIRLDLDYLENVISTQGAIFTFNANGPLRRLAPYKKPIDTVAMYNQFKPTKVRALLKKSGLSGTLQIDIRRMSTPKTPIVGIAHLFDSGTQSVGNIAPVLATQSISRSASPISTQSITFAKAALNIQSIINVGVNLWRYNLDAAPDSDWLSGATVTFGSCSNALNDGTFSIIEINQSGYPSVVISNSSGVSQNSAAGSAQINIMSYNQSNPVSAEFLAGDQSVFAGHTSGTNDGTFAIYKTNQAGNNIWVVHTGVTQGAASGTVSNLVWVFTFTSAPVTPDFTVGEKAKMASHTSGGNNGNFAIRAISSGGNNLYVYNPAGVAQAGVAGNVNTNRWVYALSVNPTADITAGDSLQLETHTAPGNNGIFVTKQVNHLGTNNVVIYNESGVTQGTVTGFVRTVKKLIQFSSDQSTVYSIGNYIDIIGVNDPLYNYTNGNDSFPIIAINYGGGANYNVVISVPTASKQVSPAGYIYTLASSILTAPFTIAADTTGQATSQGAPDANRFVQGSTTNVDGLLIPDGTPVALFVLSVPGGNPQDLTVIMH